VTIRCVMMGNPPLYVRVIGDAWAQVAEPIRRVHASHSIIRASGRLRVEDGRHFLARMLARMLRLPRPTAAAETHLTVTAGPEGEHWQRTFNGRRLKTRQYESNTFELAEQFGVLEFRFRLDASGGNLLYVQQEAAVLFGPVRLRIPAAWAPRVEAREDPAGPTRIKVAVRVALPGIGQLIAYDGFVDIEDLRP
jgi:hypothetical protein